MFEPDYAVSPGATIRECIEFRGLTPAQFAEAWTIPEIEKLLSGENPVTEEIAKKLELGLKVPARFWLERERHYRHELLRIVSQGKRLLYFKTSGKWIKREWTPLCNAKVNFSGKCQGREGHSGRHWCYRPDGSYEWAANEKEEYAGGTIPPDHHNYIHPKEKMVDHWSNFYTETEITDPSEIDRLEKREIRDGESLIG